MNDKLQIILGLPVNIFDSIHESVIDYDTIISFLRKHGLDGVDFIWDLEEPGVNKNNLSNSYIHHLKNLRVYLSPSGYLQGITLLGNVRSVYKVKELSRLAEEVDVITLAYLEEDPEKFVTIAAPLNSLDFANLEYIVNNALSRGVPASKVLLALPTFGFYHYWHKAPHTKMTWTTKRISYGDICKLNKKVGGLSEGWDTMAATAFMTSRDVIITYDNEASYKEKLNLVVRGNLKGVSLFRWDEDDTTGACGGVKFPLTKTAFELIRSRDLLKENDSPAIDR